MKFWAPVLILVGMTFVSCGKKPEAKGPVNHYRLTGKVVGLDPETHSATIEHEDILDASGKVWMKGMTMDFPVKDAAEYAKLRPGMAITARLSQRESDAAYWIDDIQPAGQTPQNP